MQRRVGSLRDYEMLAEEQATKNLFDFTLSIVIISYINNFHSTLITFLDALHAGIREIHGYAGLISLLEVKSSKENKC